MSVVSTTTDTAALDKLSVDAIRVLSMDAVEKANSGHPGTPMALAPLAYVLFTRVMKHNPANPTWLDRDRFILSAGHASMLLYSMLYLTGYGMELEDLKGFRQLDSKTPGHPEYNHAPGIEVTTGPLGQGIANAVGFALGERMLNARYGDIVDHHTFVIASDGDMEEGVSSEAGSLAGHLGLGRLIVVYDRNHITLDGEASMSISEDTGKRYEAYGWHVEDLGELPEATELDDLEAALNRAKAQDDRPSLLILRTHIGIGAPTLHDTAKAHGNPLGEEEIRGAKEAYGYPSMEPFYVADEALAHFRETVGRGEELEAEWQKRYDAWKADHADLAAEWERAMRQELPDGWEQDMPTWSADDDPIATRKAGAKALEWVASKVPNVVGGAADLSTSTNAVIPDSPAIVAGDYSGRNINFGIREHAMAAAVNGLVVQGFRAFGSTFFNFLDYCKPPLRLAALARIPSVFVFTHDSIGLGEDGPTHQPVEQLWALRATPNFDVIRPGDANETALAWKHAVQQTDTPVAMVLSRQNLPVQDGVPADAVERGAYVLREAQDGEPRLILIGTGSEVHLCMQAADLLEQDGIATRVVSAPCLDRFELADADYRESVLPSGVRARMSVEAGATIGWHRWTGDQGATLGLDGFGASAPQKDLYEHFGFTPENIASQARKLLA
jgi:transketolase